MKFSSDSQMLMEDLMGNFKKSMNKKNRLCIYVTIGVAAHALYYALGVLFKF